MNTRLSNLIAEEIENMVAEAVKKTAAPVNEAEFEEEDIYTVETDTALGDFTVPSNGYVYVDAVEDDKVIVDILDEDAEEVEVKVEVPVDAFATFVDAAEYVEVDDEALEGTKTVIRHGKKVKVDNHKSKKGFKKVIVNGKFKGYRKMTSDEKKAAKKAAKVLAKANKSGAVKKMRAKSMAKARKLAEGFDIKVGDLVLSVNEGDTLTFEGDMLSVERDGAHIASGIEVGAAYESKCEEAGVFIEEAAKDEDVCPECGKNPCECEDKEDDDVTEGAILSFEPGKGYVLTNEGVETVMGNRIRTRAILTQEGYTFDSDMLDRASNGEKLSI